MKTDIVVIGGGLAGLAAANALTRKSSTLRVTILEAAQVLGGRCRQVNVGGITFEAGCEFLHGGGSAAKQLADAIGLETERVFTTAHGDGGPGDEPAPDGSVGYYYVREQVHAHDNALLSHLNEALWSLADAQIEPDDTRSLAEYLYDEGVRDTSLLDLAKASYANTLGVGDALESLPLRACCKLEKLWQAMDGEGDYRTMGGDSFATLLSPLPRDATVHLNCHVVRIEATAGATNNGGRGVSVVCSDGRRFSAARAIVAVPVCVLQRGGVQFAPPLPRDKAAALQSIRMHAALKLMLVFAREPWTAASEDGDDEPRPPKVHAVITAGRPGDVVPEMWFKRSGANWLASGFATGAYAVALAGMGEARAVELMVAQLSKVLPGRHVASAAALRSMLCAARMFDWAAEPHVHGGYSAPSVGEAEGTRALYRRVEWDGRLSFCGEASEDAMMTMSAAVLSGRRAANEVLAHPSVVGGGVPPQREGASRL